MRLHVVCSYNGEANVSLQKKKNESSRHKYRTYACLNRSEIQSAFLFCFVQQHPFSLSFFDILPVVICLKPPAFCRAVFQDIGLGHYIGRVHTDLPRATQGA